MTRFTTPDRRSDLVSMAFEIVEMAREIKRLREQVESLEWYKQEYFKETERNLKNTQNLTAAIICAATGNTDEARQILSH